MDERVRIDPRYVEDRLKDHKSVLLQDVDRLRTGWKIVNSRQWDNPNKVSAVDYLRSDLITFQTSGREDPSSPGVWHRFVLEYCRSLGVKSDAIHRLFLRLRAGDVSDNRAVEFDADEATIQFDLVIAKAYQQRLNGDPVIHADGEPPKLPNPQSDDPAKPESIGQVVVEQWSVARKKAEWIALSKIKGSKIRLTDNSWDTFREKEAAHLRSTTSNGRFYQMDKPLWDKCGFQADDFTQVDIK